MMPNAYQKREESSMAREAKEQGAHQSKMKHSENGTMVDLSKRQSVEAESLRLVEDQALAIQTQDSWIIEASQETTDHTAHDESNHRDDDGPTVKRHKAWQNQSPNIKPQEVFPGYGTYYFGPPIPHPIDLFYSTEDQVPVYESEAPAIAGEIHGNYSLRLSSHPRQAWVEQSHVNHMTAGNVAEPFHEDNPLPAYFNEPHAYSPQWVYPSQFQHFTAVTPSSEPSPMYHGHDYPSMMPASLNFSPHYRYSQQDTQGTLGSSESAPRDFSESKTTSLFMACDSESLSEYQCLLRKQIELFSATYLDIQMTVQGRNRKIHVGQVGVRCRHCADIPIKKRARGAVYYPSKLSCIYQAAQNMAGVHLTKHCTRVPVYIRTELLKKDRKSSAGSGKDYWAVGARSMGIVEIDGRLWYESDAPACEDPTVI